jgi:hypothetical protein
MPVGLQLLSGQPASRTSSPAKPENDRSAWRIWLTEPYYRQKQLNDPVGCPITDLSPEWLMPLRQADPVFLKHRLPEWFVVQRNIIVALHK